MNELARTESFEQVDQFARWRAALEAIAAGAADVRVAYERGAPSAGYYKRTRRISATDRTKVYDAVGIWLDDGEWVCLTSGGFTPTGADAIEELFVSVNSQPIPFELFEAIMAGGAWPDAVAPVDAPAADLPPHEAAAAELKAQQDAAKAWLIGLKDDSGKPRKPATQGEADKASNYGAEFAKIGKKAEAARVAEKAPLLEAERAIDAKWKPIVEASGVASKWAVGLSDEFARAETARRQREANAENERLRKEFEEKKRITDAETQRDADLRAAGVRLPEAAPPIEPPKQVVAEAVKVGTVGRAKKLHKVPTYELIDGSALLHFLADRNERSLKLLEIALAEGKTLCEAGMTVPGILIGEKEEMR